MEVEFIGVQVSRFPEKKLYFSCILTRYICDVILYAGKKVLFFINTNCCFNNQSKIQIISHITHTKLLKRIDAILLISHCSRPWIGAALFIVFYGFLKVRDYTTTQWNKGFIFERNLFSEFSFASQQNLMDRLQFKVELFEKCC